MLTGKNALITGGSRGLGLALARALGQADCRVVLVARGESALAAATHELRTLGIEAHGIVADVADKDATYAIAGQAAALIGPVDILVHNASTLGQVPLRPLLDTDCETLEAALAANVIGPFRLTKAVAGGMVLRGAGLVISISSDAAVEAYPEWGAYAVSKAALDHLTRTFAVELEGTGVAFVSIDPGEMDTAMHADAMPNADRTQLARPDDIARRIASAIVDGRIVARGTRLSAKELAS